MNNKARCPTNMPCSKCREALAIKDYQAFCTPICLLSWAFSLLHPFLSSGAVRKSPPVPADQYEWGGCPAPTLLLGFCVVVMEENILLDALAGQVECE